MPVSARGFALTVRLGLAPRSAPTASAVSNPMGNIAFLAIVAAIVCGFIFRKKIVAFVKAKFAKKAE